MMIMMLMSTRRELLDCRSLLFLQHFQKPDFCSLLASKQVLMAESAQFASKRSSQLASFSLASPQRNPQNNYALIGAALHKPSNQ